MLTIQGYNSSNMPRTDQMLELEEDDNSRNPLGKLAISIPSPEGKDGEVHVISATTAKCPIKLEVEESVTDSDATE